MGEGTQIEHTYTFVYIFISNSSHNFWKQHISRIFIHVYTDVFMYVLILR